MTRKNHGFSVQLDQITTVGSIVKFLNIANRYIITLIFSMKYCTLLLASLALASCARKAEVHEEETAPVAISFFDSISVDSLEQIIYDSMDPGTEEGEIALYTLVPRTIWLPR